MKDPSDAIRQWVYDTLNGNVTYNSSAVSVYSFVPFDAAFPYIVIGDQSMSAEEGTKDCYITNNDIMLEFYSSFDGNDATYAVVNSIADDSLQLLRTRTVQTITGYNPISITLVGSLTDRLLFEDHIEVYKSLTINLILEENE